jgi:hypothetical protein
MALDADELQYERGYGPCVDAGRAGQMFLINDMRTNNAGLTTPSMSPHAAYSARSRCRCRSKAPRSVR